MADKTNLNFEFDELENDTEIQAKIENLQSSIDNIGEIVKTLCRPEIYEKLNTKEKVKYNNLLGYSLTTLYWMYIRTLGQDPNTTVVKNEISKLRVSINREREINDRALRPKVDTEAAKRFVKSGLWDPKNKSHKSGPPNKKIKFSDD